MILPRITLTWAKTSELSANSRLHWSRKAKLIAAQKRMAHALALEAGWHKVRVPDGAVLCMTLIYCPPTRVSVVDDDNVVTANKGARDALAAVLRVDDSRIVMRAPVRGERCRDGAVIVEMGVVE